MTNQKHSKRATPTPSHPYPSLAFKVTTANALGVYARCATSLGILPLYPSASPPSTVALIVMRTVIAVAAWC